MPCVFLCRRVDCCVPPPMNTKINGSFLQIFLNPQSATTIPPCRRQIGIMWSELNLCCHTSTNRGQHYAGKYTTGVFGDTKKTSFSVAMVTACTLFNMRFASRRGARIWLWPHSCLLDRKCDANGTNYHVYTRGLCCLLRTQIIFKHSVSV